MQLFLCYWPFWEKYIEWNQMALNTKRSKVPHTHITTVHDSQISFTFALEPVVFQIQAILRQMHWMILKWCWTLKGQRYPIYMLQLWSTESQNFIYFFLQPAVFEIQSILRQVHWLTPKWPYTLKSQNYHIYIGIKCWKKKTMIASVVGFVNL